MRTESYWLHHRERITHSLKDLQSSHPASFGQRPPVLVRENHKGTAQHMVGSLICFLKLLYMSPMHRDHIQFLPAPPTHLPANFIFISLPTSRPLFLYNPLSPGVDHIPMYVESTTECGETCQWSHPQRKETLPPQHPSTVNNSSVRSGARGAPPPSMPVKVLCG